MADNTRTGAENTDDVRAGYEFTRTPCERDPRFYTVKLRFEAHPPLPAKHLTGEDAALEIAKFHFASMYGMLKQLELNELAEVIEEIALVTGILKSG
jgi:hypothetical protein